MLVIQTFLSFELASIIKKYGSRLLFKKAKKKHFHPPRQRQRKHDPLDPAWHEYAISPPERVHFLGLSLHGGITSASNNSGEIFPCSIRRLREPCAFFVT